MSGATFVAAYRGVCEECGDDIDKGQDARFVVGGIAHVHCPDATHLTPRQVCPRCFLELPVAGPCECSE